MTRTDDAAKKFADRWTRNGRRWAAAPTERQRMVEIAREAGRLVREDGCPREYVHCAWAGWSHGRTFDGLRAAAMKRAFYLAAIG